MDAYNEVYSAGAMSLLNIADEQAREDMTVRMGHYFSAHPKIEAPAEEIIAGLRERVEQFVNHPLVAAGISAPLVEQEPPFVEEMEAMPTPAPESVPAPVTVPEEMTTTDQPERPLTKWEQHLANKPITEGHAEQLQRRDTEPSHVGPRA